MARFYTLITIGIGILFCLSVAGLVIILQKLDPTANGTNPLLIYLDQLALIFSFSYLVGFGIRRVFGVRELTRKHFIESLRQGLWFGLLAVSCFVLLAYGLFNWINAILLVLCLSFLEGYLLFK